MTPATQGWKQSLSGDLLASVVVFLVALPLCMGVAIASGAPPAAGLITGIIGGLVVGFIQGSPLQVSGPAAGLAVIVFELIAKHGIAALGVIVLGAGAIQMAAALMKGGRWFRAVPPSVIFGMLAGIGVLIFASQFHVMVDDGPKGSGIQNLLSVPSAVWKGLVPHEGGQSRQAAIVGVATILTLIAWTRVPGRLKTVPGPLVAVIVGTVIANVFRMPIAHVPVPDSLLDSAILPTSETLRFMGTSTMWLEALAVAIVASAETLLCAGAVDRMHSGPRTNYNRELLAQGVGNALCGLVGGLPMTGVIVRSSANVQAGAKARTSAIFHGVWILLLVVVFPGVLRFVPVSSLAAVLVFTGYKLVNPTVVKQLVKYGRSEVAIYVITIVAIVTTDLLKGVMIGFGLAVLKLLYKMSRLEIELEDDPDRQRTVLHLRGAATFFRLADIAETLERIPRGRRVHIRFDQLEYLDHATLETFTNWEKQHVQNGGSFVVDWAELESRYHLPSFKRDVDPLAGVPQATVPPASEGSAST